MGSVDIVRTMKILGKKYPRSTTTLNTMRGSNSAYEILISCLLSLRARDEILEKGFIVKDSGMDFFWRENAKKNY